MPVEIRVPSVGESVSEAVIAEWLVSEGQGVQRDQPLLVLDTDKANMELPAPATGRLSQILGKPGQIVRVGDVIGYLEEGVAGDAPAPEAPKAAAPPEAPKAAAPEAPRAAAPVVTPAARRLLADQGLRPAEVATSGRIGKEDVQRHLEARKPAPETEARKPSAQETEAHRPPEARKPAPWMVQDTEGRRQEVVPMSPLRKRVAKRLVEAQQTAALLTTFNEVDMSAVMALRKRYQEEFLKVHGVKIGFMSFFVKAAVEALKAFPELNAYIEDDSIVYHEYFDVGVAVSAPKGLVVPVLRNAERLSFAEVEKAIGDFGERAKASRLALEELQGGTFTISNGGVFGSMMSTPIVNPPQSGILGMHKIMDRPVAVDGQVVIRPMMYLALTYDHRIVDGREAVSFLVRVKDCLENPLRLLLEI